MSVYKNQGKIIIFRETMINRFNTYTPSDNSGVYNVYQYSKNERYQFMIESPQRTVIRMATVINGTRRSFDLKLPPPKIIKIIPDIADMTDIITTERRAYFQPRKKPAAAYNFTSPIPIPPVKSAIIMSGTLTEKKPIRCDDQLSRSKNNIYIIPSIRIKRFMLSRTIPSLISVPETMMSAEKKIQRKTV